MRRRSKYFLYLLLFAAINLVFADYSFCEDTWEQVFGINDSDLKEVCVDYDTKGVIYAAGKKALYGTEDGGVNWTVVFSCPANDSVINFIKAYRKGVFVCSSDGVYASNDGKSNWKKIFKGIGKKENNVSHIAFLKEREIYLATNSGIFISDNNGLTWSRNNPGGDGVKVKWIDFFGETIFAATAKGLYKNSGSGWKRVFVTGREDVEYDADIEDESLAVLKPINSITVDKNIIYLATDSGIFASEDKGETWKSFIDTGLASLRVKRVLAGDDLFAATDKGIFVFSDKDKAWRNLYKGMAVKEVNSITIGLDGNIWAATKKGLYNMRRTK